MSRLDAELVRRGLAQSRERAKEYIASEKVTVNGTIAKKPSESVSESDKIELSGETLKYVGRGGLKLEKAMLHFNIDVAEKICLDIGASTGGFTDCLLQFGAKTVYAVDVGHGQLAEKLRNDPRVINIEGKNVRDIKASDFACSVDFVCADLSFISVKYAADAAARVLDIGGRAVLLIKPQFEAGKKFISKGGIVRDSKVRAKVLEETCRYITSLNFEILGLVPSPIKGGDGNTEYLIYIVKRDRFTPYDADFAQLGRGDTVDSIYIS